MPGHDCLSMLEISAIWQRAMALVPPAKTPQKQTKIFLNFNTPQMPCPMINYWGFIKTGFKQ